MKPRHCTRAYGCAELLLNKPRPASCDTLVRLMKHYEDALGSYTYLTADE